MNVGVLASGTGTNLQALLDRVHGRYEVRIVAVASDQPAAPALERARRREVDQGAFPTAAFADRDARDLAMAAWLQEREVELVALAGYGQLLSSGFLRRFPGRVINVHPALLPAFPGNRPVQDALAYGVKVFGVTVHFVDEGMDTGSVILQRAVELDDAREVEEVLSALHPIEYELLPRAVELIAGGRVRPDPDHPRRILLGR